MGLQDRVKAFKTTHLSGRGRDGKEFEISQPDHSRVLEALIHGSSKGSRAHAEYRMLDTYVQYICTTLVSKCHSENTLSQSVGLFALVITFFSSNARGTVQQLFQDHEAEVEDIIPVKTEKTTWRRYRVDDVVQCIALWIMEQEFSLKFNNPQVRIRYFKINGEKNLPLARTDDELEVEGRFSIPTFAECAGLLPKIQSWVIAPNANPREEIPKRKLNARVILRVGQIEINWTFDVSQHMTHSQGTLNIFCMPSRFLIDPETAEEGTPELALTDMEFKREYISEVLNSYHMIFGPDCKAIFEDLYASGHIPAPRDPYLRDVCTISPERQDQDKLQQWSKEQYRYLWPRIKELELYLQNIQPDSFRKLLYRDRRDSYGWYTFLFAVLVLILTFVGTALTFVQTVKLFLPLVPLASPSTSSTASHSSSTRTTSLTTSTHAHTSTTLHSTSTTRATATSTPTPTSPTSSSSGLGNGAVAGIGIGVGLALLVAIAAVIFVLRRRRLRRHPYAGANAPGARSTDEQKPSYPFPPSEVISTRRVGTELSSRSDGSSNRPELGSLREIDDSILRTSYKPVSALRPSVTFPPSTA